LDIKMLVGKRTFLRSERHMDDVELKWAVESEPNFELRIIAAEIGVAVTDGVVTLTSRVPSYWEKVAAERAAARGVGCSLTASQHWFSPS
jgi:osmotically-inducible protein OsmY